MIEPSFLDDMDFDIGGDFFDHIDDLLDFPNEDVDGGDGNGFQDICPAPLSDVVPGSGSSTGSGSGLGSGGSGLTGNNTNSSSELPTELSVPQEDIAQLEWLSNFVEDSFSAGSFTLDPEEPKNNNHSHPTTTITTTTATANTNSNTNKDSHQCSSNKDSHQFRTSSPVSVLESSSSSSGGKSTLLSPDTVIPGRARSKRPRPATFNPRPVLPLISPTSSITEPTSAFSSELASELDNFAESHPANKIVKPAGSEEKKKKKKKFPSVTDQTDLPHQPMAVRKCLHCEITKTPQWRAGPLGPKTLCNACGVRYKSGRLFPEYRPAASPTFVASLHSNSHKKVLEMRIKGDQNMTGGGTTASAMTPPPEFLPRSSYLMDYI